MLNHGQHLKSADHDETIIVMPNRSTRILNQVQDDNFIESVT